MQEASLGRSTLTGFCPVVFALPGGFLNVMPYARPLTAEDAEQIRFDFVTWTNRESHIIPVEHKLDSVGWYRGEIVAIDYGD
jgi:hypothetical protein